MRKTIFFLTILTTICSFLWAQEDLVKKNIHDVHNKNIVTFKIIDPPKPFIVNDTLKGKSIYHYFVYTVENKEGVVVAPENLVPGDVLAEDVYTLTGVLSDKEYVETPDGEVKLEEATTTTDNFLKNRKTVSEPKKLPLSIAGIRDSVRLFVKGHTLDEKDIRILKRVPYNVLIANNQRYNASNMKLNTDLPLNVIDFHGNTVLERGVKLNARNLAILRQLPIGDIKVQRSAILNLDVRVFQDYKKTMQCLPGCDEEYDTANAYPGTKFKCGELPDVLAKLGIKRITKKSYYTGEDDVLGCGNMLTTPQAELIPLHHHPVIDQIWENDSKVCQFCMKRFQVKNIKNYHKAKLKNPNSGTFFEEKIQRFSPDSKVALGSDTFTLRDIKEYIPEEVECPACGKWLRQDLDFLDLNIHPLKNIEKDKPYYENMQTIPFGHSVRGIAVFSDISKFADKVQIVVNGLDENIYEPVGSEYMPIAPKNMAKVDDSNKYIRRLVINYERNGDEYNTPRDEFIKTKEDWQYFRQDIFANRGEQAEVANAPADKPAE